MTRVIHVNDAPADWRNRPEEFVYIGRVVPRRGLKKSRFANWIKRSEYEIEELLQRYEATMRRHLMIPVNPALPSPKEIKALHGKTLVCWCAPNGGVTRDDKPWCCHGQVLAQLAEELNEEKR